MLIMANSNIVLARSSLLRKIKRLCKYGTSPAVSDRSHAFMRAPSVKRACTHATARASTITLIRWIFRQIKGPHVQKGARGLKGEGRNERWTIGKSRDRQRLRQRSLCARTPRNATDAKNAPCSLYSPRDKTYFSPDRMIIAITRLNFEGMELLRAAEICMNSISIYCNST